MHAAFYQELVKLSAKERTQKGFQAAILAHELGHARDFETRRVPNLRKAVESGVEWGGRIGSVIGVMRGSPGVAAISRGISQIPALVDEATASYTALKELEKTKGFTTAEHKKMRRHLLSAGATYLGQAAVQTGMAAGAAAAVNYKADPLAALPLGLAASLGVGIGLGKLMQHVGKNSPVITPAQGDRLKKQMQVQAGIYRGKQNLQGVAAYVTKYPGKLTRDMRLKVISSMLPGKQKNTMNAAKRMLREGGIIVSPQELARKVDRTRRWPLMQKAAAEKKPRLAGRIAKGVGLGAVTLGTAGGIAALALGKHERRLIGSQIKRYLAKRGLVKAVGKKAAGAVEASGKATQAVLQKTSASPWSTLGSAVAR